MIKKSSSQTHFNVQREKAKTSHESRNKINDLNWKKIKNTVFQTQLNIQENISALFENENGNNEPSLQNMNIETKNYIEEKNPTATSLKNLMEQKLFDQEYENIEKFQKKLQRNFTAIPNKPEINKNVQISQNSARKNQKY